MSKVRCYIGAGDQCHNCGLPEPMHSLPHQQCPISGKASVRAMADAGVQWAIDALARHAPEAQTSREHESFEVAPDVIEGVIKP